METEQLWMRGVLAPRTTTEILQRAFCGLSWKKRITHTIPEKAFDTRAGDLIPDDEAKLSECEVRRRHTGALSQVYIYPGTETENHGFEHAVGRRGLVQHITLIHTIATIDGPYITAPSRNVHCFYRPEVTTPSFSYEYTLKYGFMVFEGPWDVKLSLYFRDTDQAAEYTHHFSDESEVPEAAA
jgi:hypothetical protein